MSESPFMSGGPAFDELDPARRAGQLSDEDELDYGEEEEELDAEAGEEELEELGEEDLDDDAGNRLATAPRRPPARPGGASSEGNRAEGGAARLVLEHIARSIVDEPEAVEVEVSPARSGVKLSLHVSPSDMGRIIGRRGRVAQAMRTVVRAAAASEGGDAVVDIVD